jgi:hypothetical protein
MIQWVMSWVFVATSMGWGEIVPGDVKMDEARQAATASKAARGWKWDVDIYDRPGWQSFTYQFPLWGSIARRANNEIVIRFDTADSSGINDDFYFEHYRAVVLSSKDGGKSWKEIDQDWDYNIPLKLSDGMLIEVIQEGKLKSRAEQKARLEELGLGHVWRDDCLLAWDLWPESHLERLKAEGYNVWSIQGIGKNTYLPEGVVATHAPSALVARRSADGGKTWVTTPAHDLAGFVHIGEGFPGAAVLADDTVLVPFYAVEQGGARPDRYTLGESWVYVLRSQDKGRNWELIRIPESKGLNETFLLAHPSGRVIALMRGGISCSISDDGGKTWSPAQQTGMKGAPMSAICLKSGSLLCTYTRREFPAGVRATLSTDRGESWDVANEKILRDDVLPESYIGGPGSVQLDDGTIFTFYNLTKLVTPKPEDEVLPDKPLLLHPRFHCYIAGSCYTEDYVGVLGR